MSTIAREKILHEILERESNRMMLSKISEDELKIVKEVISDKLVDFVMGMRAIMDKIQNDPESRDIFIEEIKKKTNIVNDTKIETTVQE
jgi:hypothetical protein